MDDLPRFLTVEQAGELVQLSERTIRRLIDSGEIPSIKIGDSIRVPSRWIDLLQTAAMRERSSPVEVEGSGA